jgi:hypothetical protein
MGDHSRYYAEVEAADKKLQDRLACLRMLEESGDLTVREAADDRIRAMTSHLAACQELREKYLESGETPRRPIGNSGP